MEEPGMKQPKNANYGACAFWCLILLLITIGGLVFAIVYITEVVKDDKAEEVPTTIPPPMTTVCETAECVSLAASLLQTMDTSINPCNDFYEYACGSWIKSTVIPEGRDVIGNMYSHEDKQRDLRVLLESPAKPNEPEAITKVKALYSSCVDKETRESNGIVDVNNGVESEFGGWPVLEDNPGGNFDASAFDMTALIGGLFISAGSTSLLRVVAAQQEDESYKLEIQAGTFTGLPSAEYLVESKYQKERDAYVKYMTDVAVLLGARPSVAEPEMLAVLDLEQQLARAFLDSDVTSGNYTTVAEMQQLYSEIDWLVLLKQLVPETVANITEDSVVVDYDSIFLRKALDILNAIPERLISDWMLWLCYDDATPYLNDAIRNARIEYQVALGTPATEYYQDCVDVAAATMHSAIARLYVEEYFSEEAANSIEDVFDVIQESQLHLVEDSALDEQVKEWAISKLENTTVEVVFPPYIFGNDLLDLEYEDLELPGSSIFDNFLKVLSFRIRQNIALLSSEGFENDFLYGPDSDDTINTIGLSPDVAQPPLFSEDWPWFLNYGNLGMIVGGLLTEELGPIEYFPDTAVQCVQEQYSQFWFPENGKNLEVDTLQVLADNAGLQVATKAFMGEQWSRDLHTLPGLPLTAQQLFFLNNAQAWCDKYTTEYADTFDSQYSPVPGRFRVNAMMQNSAAFAGAFECPAGSRMNPEEKCTLYRTPWA